MLLGAAPLPALGDESLNGDIVIDEHLDDERDAEIETVSPTRRLWRAVAFPVTFFVALGAVLMLLSWYSSTHMAWWEDYGVKVPHTFKGDHLFSGWMRYDAYYYTDISDHGYKYTPGTMSSVAFFPAYPLTMRAIATLTTDYVLAGILLTFLSGLGFAVLFYRWCCLRFSTSIARLAVVMLFLFPYAWYLFGAVYADAFFLFFTMAAFMLLEKDRPILAGIAAAIATGARPVGVGVFVGLLAVELDRRRILEIPFFDRVHDVGWAQAWHDRHEDRKLVGVNVRNARGRDVGLVLSLGGLIAWCTYLWHQYGDAFLFTKIEGVPGWDQAQGPPTWFKFHWFDLLSQYRFFFHDRANPASFDNLVYTSGVTFQAALAIGFLLLVPLVIRRVGWSYAAYVVTVVFIPIVGTKDWQGTGRYLLGAFPVFVALAAWLIERHHDNLRRVMVGASGALLLFLTSAFARGYYLS